MGANEDLAASVLRNFLIARRRMFLPGGNPEVEIPGYREYPSNPYTALSGIPYLANAYQRGGIGEEPDTFYRMYPMIPSSAPGSSTGHKRALEQFYPDYATVVADPSVLPENLGAKPATPRRGVLLPGDPIEGEPGLYDHGEISKVGEDVRTMGAIWNMRMKRGLDPITGNRIPQSTAAQPIGSETSNSGSVNSAQGYPAPPNVPGRWGQDRRAVGIGFGNPLDVNLRERGIGRGEPYVYFQPYPATNELNIENPEKRIPYPIGPDADHPAMAPRNATPAIPPTAIPQQVNPTAGMTPQQALDYVRKLYAAIGVPIPTQQSAPQQAPVQQQAGLDRDRPRVPTTLDRSTGYGAPEPSDRIREIIQMMKEEQGAVPTYQPVQPRDAAELLRSLVPQQQPLPRWAQIADMAGQAFLNAGAAEPFQRARAFDAQRRSDITEAQDKARREAFATLEAQLGLDKFAADSANDDYRNRLAARDLELRTTANALDLYKIEKGLEVDQRRLDLDLAEAKALSEYRSEDLKLRRDALAAEIENNKASVAARVLATMRGKGARIDSKGFADLVMKEEEALSARDAAKYTQFPALLRQDAIRNITSLYGVSQDIGAGAQTYSGSEPAVTGEFLD